MRVCSEGQGEWTGVPSLCVLLSKCRLLFYSYSIQLTYGSYISFTLPPLQVAHFLRLSMENLLSMRVLFNLGQP